MPNVRSLIHTSRSRGMHMDTLMASCLLGCFAASLILTVPGFAGLPLKEAGQSSFTPQQESAFWLSNEQNYTFGFKGVGSAGEYLLSIWLSRDPQKTALWWAKFGDDPIVKDGATFGYTSTGNLELYNGSTMLVWSSNTSSSYAELQDSGNLVLLRENKVDIVWQSFEDPRDSLMLVELDAQMVTNKPYLLQSRRNLSSYAAGRSHLATDGNENVYLHGLDAFNKDFVYRQYAHINTSEGFQIGQTYGENFTGSNLAAERLTLDYDGNLRVYSWESNVSSWQQVWQMVDNKCLVGSPCGPFGICEVVDDALNKLNCTCPPGYHDRVAGDISEGCVSHISFNASTSCGSETGSSGNLYSTTMVEMPHSDYYYYDLQTDGYPNVGLDQCKMFCLKDCACMAASYRVDYTCFLKGNSTVGYLLNGYYSNDNLLLIKDVTSISAADESGGGTRRRVWLIGFGVGAFLFVAGGAVGCTWLLWRRRSGGLRSSINGWTVAWGNEEPNMVSDTETVRFKYQELVEATNNFSELLGEGGFGNVYKGWVRGKIGTASDQQQGVAVAVKVLKGSTRDEDRGNKQLMRRADQREKQFKAEVSTLSKIHHVNLVSLLGFCTGGRAGEKRQLLVYEYMEKGSLDRFLSAAHMQQPLAWATRYSIVLGTARGIAYLHHDCSPRILHCDIKPQNVLLGQDFSAKVADFGFARPFRHQGSHLTVSGIRGTRGYMAPEWLKSDEVTTKVDVYSFGMLLLELVRGLNSVKDCIPLLEWAFQSVLEGVVLSPQAGRNSDDNNSNLDAGPSRVTDATYPQLQDSTQEAVQKLQLLKVGLWCVQPMPSMRPSMSRVVQLIEGGVDVVDPPNPAPYMTSTTTTNLSSDNDPSFSSYANSYSVVSAR